MLGLQFSGVDLAQAIEILENDCAPDRVPAMTDRGCERIRLAALRLSQGNLSKLVDAVALAQTDWRDLLMTAGFGERLNAHKDWADTV